MVPDAALLPNSGEDQKEKPKYERPPKQVLR